MILTPTRRLADILLADEGGLESFVRTRRNRTPRVSWRRITLELTEATAQDDQPGIEITEQTLRVWFADEAQAS